MIKRKLLLLLVLVSFFFSCGKEKFEKVEIHDIAENRAQAKVTFNLERKIELPNIIFASVEINGELLLISGLNMLNRETCPVNIYDLNLNLKESYFLRFGQGPADISTMTFFFLDKNLLRAIDLQNLKISIFDLNASLKFINTSRLKGIFYLPRVSENSDYIAFSGMDWTENQKINCPIYCAKFPSLDDSRKIDEVTSGNIYDEKKRSILGKDPFVDYFFKNGYLYSLDMQRYIVTKTEINTGKAKKIRVNFAPITLSLNVSEEERIIKELRGRKATLNEYTVSENLVPTSWMVPLGKGFAIIRRQNFEQEKVGEVEVEADYFDYDLNLIGKIKIPYFFRYNSFRSPGINYYQYYSNNSFFTIEDTDDKWILKKWQVDESEIKSPNRER